MLSEKIKQNQEVLRKLQDNNEYSFLEYLRNGVENKTHVANTESLVELAMLEALMEQTEKVLGPLIQDAVNEEKKNLILQLRELFHFYVSLRNVRLSKTLSEAEIDMAYLESLEHQDANLYLQ